MTFLAEIDPVQIIIIVIAMGAGFIQWLWGLLKQNLEDKQRRQSPPPTDEDRAARDAAWQQQSGREPAPARRPAPANDPWGTVRDVFEQMKEESRKARQPAPAPPSPQRPSQTQPPARAPQRRPNVRAELSPPPLPSAPSEPTPKGAPPAFFAPLPQSADIPSISGGPDRKRQADFQGLRSLLQNPASLQQAVLLREVLGPPKALQSSADSAF